MMHWPDAINAAFEAGGSIVLWLNVRQIWRDKYSAGVHLAPVIFWTVWGGWNLWYYPHLAQYWSFYAGINVLIANATWLTLMLWYKWEGRWWLVSVLRGWLRRVGGAKTAVVRPEKMYRVSAHGVARPPLFRTCPCCQGSAAVPQPIRRTPTSGVTMCDDPFHNWRNP